MQQEKNIFGLGLPEVSSVRSMEKLQYTRGGYGIGSNDGHNSLEVPGLTDHSPDDICNTCSMKLKNGVSRVSNGTWHSD